MNLLHAGMRRSVAVAAVVSMVATVLAAVGLTASPASAADVITFRAGAQATYNQPTARVTIPAAVRETDGMLLFVTKNNAAATVTVPPAGWTLEGTRHVQHRHRDDPLQQGRGRPTTPAATRPSPSRRPPSRRSPCSPTTAPRPTRCPRSPRPPRRSTGRRTRRPSPSVATAGSLRRLLLGRQVRVARPPAGPSRPARPSAASRSAPAPGGSPPWPPTPTRPSGAGPTTGPHRHRRRLDGQGDHVDRRAPARPDRRTPTSRRWRPSPSSCPQATCTVDASGSTDTAPGTVASYAWDFGDGTTGTGVSTTHTYTTGGAKTITLAGHRQPGPGVRAGDPHGQPRRWRRCRSDRPVPGPQPARAGPAADQHPAHQQR